MLLWINGPFGGGKSQTARELHNRLPGSLICDPEQLGFGLHRMLPPRLRGDFQDFPAWRQGVYEVLDLILGSAGGTVIVPMTLIEPAYFVDVIGRLADAGRDVRHFALLADARVIERRLRERAIVHAVQRLRGQDVPMFRETFAMRNLGRCLSRLSQPDFATQVWTDHLTVPQVAEVIATSAGLVLSPHRGTAVGDRIRWASRGLRQALQRARLTTWLLCMQVLRADGRAGIPRRTLTVAGPWPDGMSAPAAARLRRMAGGIAVLWR